MITIDWQAELRGVTIGADTDFILTGPISGLGIPAPRGSDQERGNQPGNVAGHDVFNRRVITAPIGVGAATPGDVWALYEALKVAWAPSSVDLPFDLRLPGFDMDRRYYGRPRGLDANLDLLRSGWIDALATMDCLDPFAYGPEETVTLVDGDTVVTNPGHIDSDRWIIELAATEAFVSISSSTDPGAVLTLTNPAATVYLDGRTRTIVDDHGADQYPRLAPAPGWPLIAPGINTITVNGATGTLTYRPAYL